jgi:Zn-dependent alcohol dehydrogenase
MRTMRAALLEEPGKPLIVVDDIEIDDPAPGEVLVRVTHCGVCHSDLSIVDGHMAYPMPTVLGHEAAGVVEVLGEGVNDLAIGERVVVSMRPPCGQCFFCVRNQPVLCSAAGSPAAATSLPVRSRIRRQRKDITRGLRLAAFAEYVLVERSGVVRVPDQISNDAASVMGCAVQTGLGSVGNVAKVEAGATAAVFGLGGVGLAVIQGLAIAGATTIIGIDPLGARRDFALSMGATAALDAMAEDLAEKVKALTGGLGVDYVFDTVANTATTGSAAAISRSGSSIVLIGVPGHSQPMGLTAMDIVMRQRSVLGSFLGNCHPQRDIPRYFNLCCAGSLSLSALVTKRRPLEEINEAFDELRKGIGVRTVLTI